jgi:VWFA-related protein
MMKKILSALTLVLLPTTSGPAIGQETPATFAGEVQVVEVLLDVLVTDRDGNVILGLGADDFVVEEEKEPVDVTGATFYSNRVMVDAANESGQLSGDQVDIPVDRFFILFFHDDPGSGTVAFREKLDAVRQAKEWVREGLLPNDHVAIVRYTKKLLVHQDFTTDIQEILSGLDSVAKGKDPGGNWPSRLAETKGPSLRRGLPQGKELRNETTRIYSALEVVAEASGSIVGRKNLMLFSIGFGEVDIHGLFLPDRRYYDDTYQALNDNNVAVYGISMLQNLQTRDPLTASLDSALSALAADTGGRHYRSFTNYRTPLEQIVEDNNGYYLLSYSSEAPAGESGYREVSVKTVNPNFVVRARKGYSFGA